MTGKIFINYRRDDSIGTAGRLHDRLAQAFGRKNLFMDVDHIPAGVDFVIHLNNQVSGCDIFLVIIGPKWLNAQDDQGRRRLEKPDDFVVVEIAAALARNICVIPVLVDGAPVPRADELPDAIKPLVRRNAVEVRNTQFGRDAEALVEKIREAIGRPPPATGPWPSLASVAARLMGPRRWRSVVASVAPVLVVGWIGYQVGIPASSGRTPTMERSDTAASEKAKTAEDARRKAEEAERERLAAAKAEEERKAKEAADVTAKRKAEEDRQRQATLRAEEERRAKEAAQEAERQRQATLRADEERRAKAAADEARRKNEEAERQRQARADEEARRKAEEMERQRQARADEERRRQAEADRLAHQSYTELNGGDYDKAIATASEAMRLDPKSIRAFINRGVAYMRKGDNDRAIGDFGEALRLNPLSARALGERAVAYWNKNDLDRAIADVNEAIRLDPNNSLHPLNRGLAYLKKGDNDRAIADFNQAIRLDPNLARAFNGRGVAYGRKGYSAQAMADYSEAIRLAPNFAVPYCNRGRLKLRLEVNQASGNADIVRAKQLDASSCV
jgi:tetratricopeptide (TPR) repeat protein